VCPTNKLDSPFNGYGSHGAFPAFCALLFPPRHRGSPLPMPVSPLELRTPLLLLTVCPLEPSASMGSRSECTPSLHRSRSCPQVPCIPGALDLVSDDRVPMSWLPVPSPPAGPRDLPSPNFLHFVGLDRGRHPGLPKGVAKVTRRST
jgi:hypothetical protein